MMCREAPRWRLIEFVYERGGGGTLKRGGVVVGTEPNTFMAAAIIPATSETDAGTMTDVVFFASWPNCSTYCSATRSWTASMPPSVRIASATRRMPSAVAAATRSEEHTSELQ